MNTLTNLTFGPRINWNGLGLRKMITVAGERRALSRLTDHELADIGIDRATALREAARPFWDISER